MADARDFLLEEIKHLLKDVTDFLNVTLKKEKLKKEVGARRDELTQEINSVITKVDNILPKDDQEEYADVEMEGSGDGTVPPAEDDELYEDTAVIQDSPAAIPDSPNKNALSQGSRQDHHHGDEAPEPAEEDPGEPYGDMKVGPIAATDIVKPIIEGFLEKRRKEGQIGLQQWQRRYCVVKENILYYFKNRNDKQQKNVVILNGYEARPNPDFDKKHKRRDCLFELVCPAKRSFQFIASSTDEMNAWINAVAVASNVMPSPAEPIKKAETVKEEIPEDNDEFYDDVDTYQKSKLGGQGAAEDAQKTDSAELHDNEMEIIESEEVYEDVASQEPERTVRKPPPPLHHHGSLPDVPPLSPSPHLHKPTMKLPALPTPDRPKPEPPGRHADDKPAPAQRTSQESKNGGEDTVTQLPPKPEPWEEDYANIYVSMWDCSADEENELEFKRGDFVHIISKEYDSYNWWVGEKNSKIGLVPKQYLMMAYIL